MREDLPIILIILLYIIMVLGVFVLGYKSMEIENDKQIKILELELQEKQAYINMLEE